MFSPGFRSQGRESEASTRCIEAPENGAFHWAHVEILNSEFCPRLPASRKYAPRQPVREERREAIRRIRRHVARRNVLYPRRGASRKCADHQICPTKSGAAPQRDPAMLVRYNYWLRAPEAAAPPTIAARIAPPMNTATTNCATIAAITVMMAGFCCRFMLDRAAR